MPELTDEARREIRAYLFKYIIGLLSAVGVGTMISIGAAAWTGASAATKAFVENPGPVASKLGADEHFATNVAKRLPAVPIGTVVSFSGTVDQNSHLPDGWLLCDGSGLRRKDYGSSSRCWGRSTEMEAAAPQEVTSIFLITGDSSFAA